MRLHTIALGCQMSEADASEMAEPFREKGFGRADAPEDADAILLTTCTVRQHAEDRAVSLIGSLRPWKEADPRRILVVAGCAAERLGPWIRQRFPFVDLVVGAKSVAEFPRLAETVLAERFDALRESREAFPGQEPEEAGVAASVTIMRGCNYSCSYCIVPSVRGRELYRPVAEILEQVRRRVGEGAREVLLLGQTVNSYSAPWEGKTARFPDLLRLVDAVPGLERVRFMSPHPFYLDDRMIEAMAECRTVCEHLHLPVQSGSDRLLKLMKRNYTRRQYLDKVERLRRAVPRIVLSTDFIVGFPTESEPDFEESISLLDELGPAWAYTFKYSPREGTESARREDDVPNEVKKERLSRLNERLAALTEAALGARRGAEVEVLSEGGGTGRTRDGFRVRFRGPATRGELVRLRIAGATKKSLLGEMP